MTYAVPVIEAARGETRNAICSSVTGSQFTSPGACNPTLTIVTLEIRQADYIHNQMGGGAI
jgi:hypothetical protein